MRYAMVLCGVEEEWDAAESEGAMEAIYAWFAQWEPLGKIGKGGVELDSVRKARTIRPGADGPVVTDGPYLELKEVVGGIVILEADDMDEAVAIASGWPLQATSSIEVRPVMDR